MIIDIPPQIEQIIISQAQSKGISVDELIVQKFATKEMYPKGDVRRLKYIIKTDIKASINDMNNGIAMGAVYGELDNE